MNALEVVQYVVEHHEWCSASHRCKCCGKTKYCFELPMALKEKCEGCKMREAAVRILERCNRAPNGS